jgi:hypothetical protein
VLLGLVSEVLDAVRQYFDIQANVIARFPLHTPQGAAALRSVSRSAGDRITHDFRLSICWPRRPVLHLDVLVEVVAALGGAVFPGAFAEADGKGFRRFGFPG